MAAIRQSIGICRPDGEVLPAGDFALASAFLPVSADLFAVFGGSIQDARFSERFVADGLENFTVSAVLPWRLRSGTAPEGPEQQMNLRI